MGILLNVILRMIRVCMACFILLGLFSPFSFAQTVGEEEVFDIILEVKRDRKTLQRAIFGLEKNGEYYVPVQELARIVSFVANTSIEQERVDGFFFSPENDYSIDIKNNAYTLRGKKYNFDPSAAFIFRQKLGVGDIYVTPELLNKIWPLDLSLDYLQQTLRIGTNKKLPYELSQIRQSKRNRLLEKNQSKAYRKQDLNLPQIRNDYKMFSLPALDFTSNTQVGGEEGGVGQNIYVRGRNDLLNAQASYNFNIDREQNESFELNNVRFLLERQSYEEGDLPLGLQLMQFGDVRPNPSRLIDGVLVGRGFLLSSESQRQIRDFDQIVVEGVAEPGWEVELYRNNELIDFQIVSDSGEYRFENVTLNFTNTIIKTILYGPEGQILEEEQTYNISEAMLKPGKTVYEISALDLNEDLLFNNDRASNRPEGIAFNSRVEYGINNSLSAFSTFTSMPTRQDDRNYGTIGMNFAYRGLSGVAEAYKDLSGGTAYDFRAATKFLGASLNLRSALFSGFESEEANFDGAARTSRTEFSIAKPFKTFLGVLGLRFKIDNQNFEDLDDRTQFDFTQTYAKGPLRITHGNTFNYINGNEKNTDGRVNATLRLNTNWQMRSLLNYNVHPESEIRNLLSELRYRNKSKMSAAVNVNKDFINDGVKLGTDFSYDFEKFRLGLTTDWEQDVGLRSFLRLSASIAPYGKGGDYIFSSKNLSNRTSLNGLVYLDKNYDSVFNEGDQPIEDAIIEIGRRETDFSNQEGIASYIGSPKNEFEDIYLNMDSLNNPFAVTNNAGYKSLLRPATSTYLEFPVLETGVVDGIVSIGAQPLAGVRMELLYENEIVDTTSTAFDGFYTFEFVEPGQYIVRIDPSYEQIDIPPREILVTSENLFLSDIDFQIPEQAGGVSCASKTNDNGKITQDYHVELADSGIMQPAHTNSDCYVTVNHMHIEAELDSILLSLEYDYQPKPFEIYEAKDNKEITIRFKNTRWDIDRVWENPDSNILKKYMIEILPDGDSKIILMPFNQLYIKDYEVIDDKSNETNILKFHLSAK